LVGHNTDWIGAMRALEEVRSLVDARVLLVGAGGAARAIGFGLRERGARTTIANRDAAKAERLAVELGAQHAPASEVRRAGDYDVVVNATSLGQSDVGQESPIPEDALREGQLVMDIVYKPVQTRLIEAAYRRGAVAIRGTRMLLHQAAAQFELYTGRAPPLFAMDEALGLAMSK
jgi:shikimate dehydrogenase